MLPNEAPARARHERPHRLGGHGTMNTVKLPGRRAAILVMLAALLTPLIAPAADTGAPRTDFSVAAGDTDLPPAWPESVGVDSRPLVQLSEWIRKENLDVRSFLVVKDGKLIYERYGKGLTREHNYELYS